MKTKNFYILTFVLAAIAIVISCKKNVLRVSPYDGVDGKALLKVNYASPYLRNPTLRIKLNDEIVSSGITYTTPYPGGGYNTQGNSYADYLSVVPGDVKLALVQTKVGSNVDSIVYYSATINLKPNAFQTVHITDTMVNETLNNTTNVITLDYGTRPDSGRVLYRFINLIPNAGPLDLYYGPNKLVSGLDYKKFSDTFSMQSGASQTAGWILRKKDSTAILGSAYTASAAGVVANQRVFTVYARGYAGLPAADIRSPKVSLLFNK